MTAPRNDLTAEFVRSVLDYDPETGVFTWKWRENVSIRCNTKHAGKRAGYIHTTMNGKRYRLITVNTRLYKAHRLAWLHVTGEWPADEVDHEDGDGLNNRFSNLRQATHDQNGKNIGIRKNNTSGFKGVCWNKARGKWQAATRFNDRRYYLGLFDTPEEAHAAYCAAARELHGEFARMK